MRANRACIHAMHAAAQALLLDIAAVHELPGLASAGDDGAAAGHNCPPARLALRRAGQRRRRAAANGLVVS